MLNDETVSRRLRIMAGWVRSMREGTFETHARSAENMEQMLRECAGEVEGMELELGTADTPSQLRAAGSNVIQMKAALERAKNMRGAR